MKNRRVLSVMLVIVLLLSTLFGCGDNVSSPKEPITPTYDIAKHYIISTSKTSSTQSESIDKTVYGSFELSAALDGTAYNDRILLYIGEVTIKNTSSLEKTGVWYLVFNRNTDGIDMHVNCHEDGFFYWGHHYEKFNYPDGTKNYTGPYTVSYTLSSSNLKLWMNETLIIDFDYNKWSYNDTDFTTTLNAFRNGYDCYKGDNSQTSVATVANYKIWTDK